MTFKIFDHGIGAERDATPEEIELQRDSFYGPSEQDLAFWCRKQRDGLLLESDWTQLSDVKVNMTPEKITEWLEYRTALRNITLQETFPHSVIFPIKPE
jgi:hypothetical protein